jgi:hypothetical protein
VPRLSLYLLGAPRIKRNGVPIHVDRHKAIALLAYLALTRERYRHDALVNLLCAVGRVMAAGSWERAIAYALGERGTNEHAER